MTKVVGGEQSGGIFGAAGDASAIPGMGAVSGLLGIGGNLLSWILGQDKYDWNAWKKEQKNSINANYDKSLGNATSTAIKTANATIGEATTKQGMAGGVSGVAGVGRLAADTYAKVAENRDSAVTNITNALEQNRSSMLSAVDREAAQGSQQEDFNAPTAIDYMNNFLKTLATPTGQEGVGALIGGIGKGANWFGNLFKGNNTNPGGVGGVTLNTIKTPNVVGTLPDTQGVQPYDMINGINRSNRSSFNLPYSLFKNKTMWGGIR